MSLFDVFTVTGSAMTAQSLRLNVVASNLANAGDVSGDPNTVYRAREPVFASMLEGQGGGDAVGVRVLGVVERQAPAHARYAPGNPLADAKGYVYTPNVDPIEEMANMISASRSYQDSVQVFDTSKQLLLSTLKLGQ